MRRTRNSPPYRHALDRGVSTRFLSKRPSLSPRVIVLVGNDTKYQRNDEHYPKPPIGHVVRTRSIVAWRVGITILELQDLHRDSLISSMDHNLEVWGLTATHETIMHVLNDFEASVEISQSFPGLVLTLYASRGFLRCRTARKPLITSGR